MSCLSDAVLIESGTPSMITWRHFLIVGNEVKTIMIEKIKVHKGSNHHKVGKNQITVAARITPIDMMRSPRTCK